MHSCKVWERTVLHCWLELQGWRQVEPVPHQLITRAALWGGRICCRICVTFPLPDVYFHRPCCDLCFKGTLTGQNVLVRVLCVLLVFLAMINETNGTRTNCFRKVRETESGSFGSFVDLLSNKNSSSLITILVKHQI